MIFLKKGDIIGEIIVSLDGKTLSRTDLVAAIQKHIYNNLRINRLDENKGGASQLFGCGITAEQYIEFNNCVFISYKGNIFSIHTY